MSKKSGPLNRVEKFYIDNHSDKDVKDIAEELNRNQKIISKYLNSKPKTEHTSKAQDEQKETLIAGELFGHKKGRGVTVMTPAASERADASKANPPKRASNSTFIHRIKD
jgi:hypothetical protein